MGKTYILGNKEHTTWANNMGQLVSIPIMTTNEYERIHDFVCKNFSSTDEKDMVVIDLDSVSEPALALTIALHIRLSLSDIGRAVLMPILFVSELPLQSFLRCGECSQIFLTLSGIAFCQPELCRDSIDVLEGLTIDNYKNDFLNLVHIKPDSELGNHSMANQWGADVFSRIISNGNREITPEIAKAKKKLYFKYVYANTISQKELFTNNLSTLGNNERKIDVSGKKILLIDDEADKGWKFVLKNWLHNADVFDVINSETKDYNDIPKEIQSKIEKDFYDLYFLDLRMMGTKEDDIYSAGDFSGMKILKEIKKINQGNQVIMLTASNKAWNMKALLDAGADGYYIKESPEQKLPKEFSLANFKALETNVLKALDSGYKKEIYRKIKDFEPYIYDSKSLPEALKGEFEYILNTVKKQFLTAVSPTDFAYSYITLYQCLEAITKEYITENVDSTSWLVNGTIPLYSYKGKNKNPLMKDNKQGPSIMQKLEAICREMGNKKFNYQEVYPCVNRRNAFIHNDSAKYNDPNNRKIDTWEGFAELLNVVIKIVKSIS